MCGSQLHTHRSPTTRGGNEKLPQGFGSQGSTSIGSIAEEAKLVVLTKKDKLTQRLSHAVGEWIAMVSRPTSTSGNVILNPTICVGATDAGRAGRHTFV